MPYPVPPSDPIVHGAVYQLSHHQVLRKARGSWFPVPAFHSLLRLHRGVLFGAYAPASGSSVWAVCPREQEPYADICRPVLAVKHGDLRDFMNGRDLPTAVRSVLQSTLEKLVAAGAKSLDRVPLVIHAIQDDNARKIAAKTFLE